MFRREQTRPVKVGPLTIGGGAPVIIESMTNTDTADLAATLAQITELKQAGCELVRVAVPNQRAVAVLPDLVRQSALPVVADIHFNHRFALGAIRAGVVKLRINPGNIGGKERLAEVVSLAVEKQVPIRIGVNAGSLEQRLLDKYGRATPEAMLESAMDHIRMAEKHGFYDMVISLKASSVPLTVAANRLFAKESRYPLHLGMTEAGSSFSGTVYSAVGIGALLLSGLGDTIRISLTAPPVEEIRVAKAMLAAAEIRRFGPRVISCPTCGRCQISLIELVKELSQRGAEITEPMTLAVMGCVVNGPGEAREADLGIAGGKNQGLIFCGGEVVRKVPQERLIDEFMSFLYKYLNSKADFGVSQK
ncbi:(E)-4-hydroxy-3-methylbut-2-enyl-diphosphate synthase [Candidatus Hakubella thermalkaliphila]|uniref:4-hydroxy-3-methylbut-2-en-1-yl diphosphate synthase (flavodoxin) n=1 Tax=Candidatus Hakubella thermalkaliphila TaxID=2754717 RepID=A0A6V8PL26_9ACTN|nr:(E)-4-hydroxy-3-methylbut-2-enyl-diphosphate synthase [Candidatus Hakubella thermalkaliphila]